ncbi:hypothetical protein DSCA_42060 [Desulfosarcina alkanivorans]|uniref:Uncharacterized protein n=1 Tax=Desulfosarcina alkanivorans TaxID=571177 RepID=A0A5K7YM45_9BACT|nr:hypothetical protein [Desulfosarcina alkanivorans]BBO70276.1 hypothetical protein DSCA_42060 [Desulfosarcina alkanivorans]
MIYSSRDILAIRSRLLAITPEQWLLLTAGLLAGGAVWVIVNRRFVRRFICRLKEKTISANGIAAVEGVIGGTVFLVNAALVYLATLVTSFFLFSFAIAGLMVGAWITIPASFE